MNAEATKITLAETQRDMLDALLEPIYGDSRSRTDLPHRAGEVSENFKQTARKLITPSQHLLPEERLELYHRQYWYRLLDTIAEDFDGLFKLIGKDTFWQLMEAYLEKHPSNTFSLTTLAENLATFITTNPHLTGDLTTHAAEITAIEYAMLIAFTQRERPLINAEEAMGKEDYQLSLQPHLHLFSLHTSSYKLLGVDAPDAPTQEILAPATTHPHSFLAVYRHNNRVFFKLLDHQAFSVLTSLQQGHSLVEAISSVGWTEDISPETYTRQISTWFSEWMSLNWLCEPQPENPAS